jgi:hypothetical protein
MGACMGLEGEHVRGGSTPGCQWAAESEQGPSDRSVLSPIGSSLHVLPQLRAHVDAIEATSTPESYCFGVSVLNCMQELKNKPFRPHQAV